MTAHADSEQKRLLSLKKKKDAFKVKEKYIRDALRNVDKKKTNKKIVFDDNLENDVVTETKGKKRKTLFDNEDDDGEEATWNEEKFKRKKNVDEKFLKLQASFGNDARFTLDDRFMEDNVEDKEENTECSVQNEKEWQFNILEDVLGTPIGSKPKDQETNKKYSMIRYDPTEDKHKEYELTTEQIQSSTKSKKKKKKAEPAAEINESEPVVVSKDIYYSVSDSLTKNLKQEGGFSLLRTYGKDVDENDESMKLDETVEEVSPKKQKSFLNFDSSNPFKYDSSDDDNEAELDTQELVDSKKKEEPNISFGRDNDNLFFSINDSRFKDAINFFNNESVPNREFNNLRRELKQIVRAKVRKNVRKNEQWGAKRKIKKLS